MNGAFASFARRRAISVLPTPVGPIMRMFLGVISPRMVSSSCMRRQRLRRAIATERLASAWPMMYRSSSETISRGVSCCAGAGSPCAAVSVAVSLIVQHLDGNVVVGVDAGIGCDMQCLFGNGAGLQFRVFRQRAGRGLRIGTAGADRHGAIFWLHD